MALSMGVNSNRVSTLTIAVNSSKRESERFAVVAVANNGYNRNALYEPAPANKC